MQTYIVTQLVEDFDSAMSIVAKYDLTDFERLTIAVEIMKVDAMQSQVRVSRGQDYNDNLSNVARAIQTLASKIK